jgi:hypothetical protein
MALARITVRIFMGSFLGFYDGTWLERPFQQPTPGLDISSTCNTGAGTPKAGREKLLLRCGEDFRSGSAVAVLKH